MLSAILMMRIFLNDFLSPYLPIPSSRYLAFRDGHFFMDDTEVFGISKVKPDPMSLHDGLSLNF
jgi:hypothetical protein